MLLAWPFSNGSLNESSVFLGRLFDRVDLIKPFSNVRLFVRTCVRRKRRIWYVCPSTKCFFDFNEIWYVGRGL